MAGTLSLPPQVNGRIHGSVRLAVERISWRVVRPPDSSQVFALLRPQRVLVFGRPPAHTSVIAWN
jgi:hypothetical protein